jgi:hypothetical protein
MMQARRAGASLGGGSSWARVATQDRGDVIRHAGCLGECHRGAAGVAGGIAAGDRAGTGDAQPDNLTDGFPEVALTDRDGEHRSVDPRVRPGPRWESR